MESYDVIIIGSGIGALTLASILARVNHKRVLVLERDYKIGGFTHIFRRKGYKWDVGIHYIGDLERGDRTRALFDFVTGGQLQWSKIPDPFEVFIYPDFRFGMYGEPEKYQQDLIDLFPDEAPAIRQYVKTVRQVASNLGYFGRDYASRCTPGAISRPLRLINRLTCSTALGTTAEYMDRHFRDSRLKALLTSQWYAYGLPPSRSAFLMHAVITDHYLNGAWYPVGGAEQIAKLIMPIVEAEGGKFLVNHEVAEIIVRNNRAVGVRVNVKKGGQTSTQEFYAPVVVSSAGAYTTYTKLAPQPEIQAALKKLAPIPTAVMVFMGLKDDPRKLGLTPGNHWLRTSYDHDQHFVDEGYLKGQPAMAWLSFPSLKDPHAKAHTAEIFYGMSQYEQWEAWKQTTWLRRGEDYEALKTCIQDGFLNLVERFYPGFTANVAYVEVATPLTFEHFMGHRFGAIYGLPGVPERYRQDWLKVQTPIKNLYLTGSDVCAHGTGGAMMGAVATAAVLNGVLGLAKMLRLIERERRTPD